MFRWGLIGAGDIVRKRVAAALRDTPGSELHAFARARVDLSEAFAREFGVPRCFATWESLVRDADVDGVYVATPVDLHAEQTIAAAEAGKHVLCEKPMALAVADCDRMIAACRANNVKLGIAYYRRFYPVITRVRAMLAAGEIGDPVFVQINVFERFNPAPDDPRVWFVKKARAGGGPMFDFGCHRLEVLLTLFGPAERVTSLVANVAFEREVEDTATALLRFASGPCAALTVTHAAFEPADTLDIFGTTGSIHVAGLNAGQARVVTAAGDRVESHPAAANLHAPLVEDFVAAVTNGREPTVTGETGRAVNALLEQIYS